MCGVALMSLSLNKIIYISVKTCVLICGLHDWVPCDQTPHGCDCRLQTQGKSTKPAAAQGLCLLYKNGTIKRYNQSQIYGFIPIPVQDSDFESDFSNLLVMI